MVDSERDEASRATSSTSAGDTQNTKGAGGKSARQVAADVWAVVMEDCVSVILGEGDEFLDLVIRGRRAVPIIEFALQSHRNYGLSQLRTALAIEHEPCTVERCAICILIRGDVVT